MSNAFEERDLAWQELRKIREIINANPEESTFDEVERMVNKPCFACECNQALLNEQMRLNDSLMAEIASLRAVLNKAEQLLLLSAQPYDEACMMIKNALIPKPVEVAELCSAP